MVTYIIQSDFLNGPVQYRNGKKSTSQPELLLMLFYEILNLREPLVGLLDFFHFGNEQEKASKN